MSKKATGDSAAAGGTSKFEIFYHGSRSLPTRPRARQGVHPQLRALDMLGSSEMRRQLLRSSALFSHLGDKEADAILAEARVVNYAEGEHIFAKGDPGNSMMAVLKGRVVISNPSLDGRQLVVTIFRESDVFGEIALLDGKERSADASAATDCELLVVPRRSLLRLLGQQPELCIELLVVLCERLRRTNEQVEDFAFLDLEARIAKTLLRLTRDEKGASSTSRLGLKISQRALGELVGGSRESVNKHLQDWKRSGIIAIEKGSILIRDLEALTDLA
jgi:CRP/FNR family cyclic AMP-dependent transcriptional regulator